MQGPQVSPQTAPPGRGDAATARPTYRTQSHVRTSPLSPQSHPPHPHHTIAQRAKIFAYVLFGQYIRLLADCLYVPNYHYPCLYQVSRVVVLHVYVLCPIMMHRVLSQRLRRLVIAQNDGLTFLRVSQLAQQPSHPN